LGEGEPIAVPGSWEEHLGGIGGIATGWYRRLVEIPEEWAGDHVVVRFGAAMEQCELWVDGVLAGTHEGGYVPFEIAMPARLRSGETHDLAVRVHNPFGAFDTQPAYSDPSAVARAEARLGQAFGGIAGGKQTWYTSTSGLIRPVTLQRRPMIHLERVAIRPDLAGKSATIRWSIASAQVGHDYPQDWLVTIDVFDPAARPVATWAAGGMAPGAKGSAVVAIPDPIPWDMSMPGLYRVEATLTRPGQPAQDAVSATFGMRDIATRDGRVLLNGRPVYLLGALDQDFYANTRSTPPSREFLNRQLERARELGLNLLRCHITVPDEAYLDAAEALGNHPSIVAWTIINESWGIDLRDSEQRAWLDGAYFHLRSIDPTRLAVDNSPFGGPDDGNFHVRTDLADYHVYHLSPDHSDDWSERIASFASRPAWMWSPAGDAAPRGDEPLILSEFGTWGLPDPRAFLDADGADPWWFATGPFAGRPEGIEDRVRRYDLEPVFNGFAGLIRATQEHQWEALRYEIAELRRHPAIAGYVVTELSDVYWEANGLLDMNRRPKWFHDRFAMVNAPDVVVAELEPRDRLGGERVHIPVTLSAWGGDSSVGGHVTWSVVIGDEVAVVNGRLDFRGWPVASAHVVGAIDLTLPAVDVASRARLALQVVDAEGRARATAELPFAILPGALGGLDRAALAAHHGVQVTDHLDADRMAGLWAGNRVLLIARSAGAIDRGIDLPWPVTIHDRASALPDNPAAGAVWQGDWISTFAWLRSDCLRNLSGGRCLDLAFQRVMPDHVLLGHADDRSWADVSAGMFTGWVHAPAAITWSMPVGAGLLTLTTLQIEPGRGPVADALFGELVRATAAQQPSAASDS